MTKKSPSLVERREYKKGGKVVVESKEDRSNKSSEEKQVEKNKIEQKWDDSGFIQYGVEKSEPLLKDLKEKWNQFIQEF